MTLPLFGRRAVPRTEDEQRADAVDLERIHVGASRWGPKSA